MPLSSLIAGPNPFGLNAMAAVAQRLSGKRADPFPGFNFLVEIDGLLTGGFTRVSGLELEVLYDQEYREGGSVDAYPVPTGVKSPPLVLEHGLTALSHGLTDVGSLWSWFEQARRGRARRRTVSVMLLDARQLPVAWWYCLDALPMKWIGPALDAGKDEIAVERVELAHRGLRRGSQAPLLLLAGAMHLSGW
ncbi:phage tail protein [Pyxidicoccus sp. 3LFB2]